MIWRIMMMPLIKVEVQKPRATGAKPSDGGSFFFSVFRWTVHPQPSMLHSTTSAECSNSLDKWGVGRT